MYVYIAEAHAYVTTFFFPKAETTTLGTLLDNDVFGRVVLRQSVVAACIPL